MDLLLKSEQIKPVKFRIVSNNVQCADFQMLKDNFLISDLQKVNDSRLHRWLISVGQSELAEQIAAQYPTSQSVSADSLGFLRLFFQEELHIYHSMSDVLYFLKNNRYSVFVDLLQSNANLLSKYYRIFKNDFSPEEWLIFFNRFPSETECISIVSEIKRKLIPDNIRGFDVVEELLEKVKRREQVSISSELYYFLEQINAIFDDITNRKIPKSHDEIMSSEYQQSYSYLLERSKYANDINEFKTFVFLYIFQRLTYFERYKVYKESYSKNEIYKLLVKANGCITMEEFDQDTFIFIKNVNKLINDFPKYKKTSENKSKNLPTKYKIAYEYIFRYARNFEYSLKGKFINFVCYYLSTVLVKK